MGWVVLTFDRPIEAATAPDGSLWYLERAGISGSSDKANSASENGSLWRVTWDGKEMVADSGTPADLPFKSAAGIKLPASADPVPSNYNILMRLRRLLVKRKAAPLNYL